MWYGDNINYVVIVVVFGVNVVIETGGLFLDTVLA